MNENFKWWLVDVLESEYELSTESIIVITRMLHL